MKRVRARFRIGSGGVLYVVVSLMILASAFYTQANLLFWGFGLVVGGLIVSVGTSAVALRGLEVKRVAPSHGAADEPLMLRYELQNRGWLPFFGVVIRETVTPTFRTRTRRTRPRNILWSAPHAWLLYLGRQASAQTAAPCCPTRRGVLRLNQIHASTSFPFGVFHKTLIFTQHDSIKIFPKLYRLRRQLLGNINAAGLDSARMNDRGGGNGDFFGVRPYLAGDSPRNIDWKRTARTGELVSRERSTPSPPQINVLLDLGNPPADVKVRGNREVSGESRQLQEDAISLAASVVCDAHARGFRVGLHGLGLPGLAFRPRHSLPHRTQLLEALAAIDLDQPRPAAENQPRRLSADVVIYVNAGGENKPSIDASPRSVNVVDAADFALYVEDSTAFSDPDLAASAEFILNSRPATTAPRIHPGEPIGAVQ